MSAQPINERYRVTVEIRPRGAVLSATETQTGAARDIGAARRNAYGWWVSDTPLGRRFYADPLPVAWDRLIFHMRPSRTERAAAMWATMTPEQRRARRESISAGWAAKRARAAEMALAGVSCQPENQF